MEFQESTTILNAYTKKVWKLIVCTSYNLRKKIQTTVIIFEKKIKYLQNRATTTATLCSLTRLSLEFGFLFDHLILSQERIM